MRLSIVAAWVCLQLDVVVAVRRQHNQRILDEISDETVEEDSHAVDALENLELSLETNATDALLNMDAVEVCGSPLRKHLDNFDSSCPGGQGGNLRVITAACGQGDGPYRLPKNRLYVCNPNSKLKGALFKQGESPKAIKSTGELNGIMKTLFAGRLFKWETSCPGNRCKRRNGKRMKAGKPHRFYLWVLDMDGNWVTGPETQEGGHILKHGDFTPGEYPWKRPKSSLLQDSEQDLAEGETAEQDAVIEQDTVIEEDEFEETEEELQAVATELEAGWGKKKSTSVPKEKRMGGNFRGLARAGGEIRFHPEFGASRNYALIEDSSGYANFRVVAKGLDPGRHMSVSSAKSHVKSAFQSGRKHQTLGRCAMKRLKDYFQGPLGLSLSGAKVAAVFFDPSRRYEHV
jgi:hypothetical protein